MALSLNLRWLNLVTNLRPRELISLIAESKEYSVYSVKVTLAKCSINWPFHPIRFRGINNSPGPLIIAGHTSLKFNKGSSMKIFHTNCVTWLVPSWYHQLIIGLALLNCNMLKFCEKLSANCCNQKLFHYVLSSESLTSSLSSSLKPSLQNSSLCKKSGI